MAIKVIQWATGTVGIHAAPAIAAHPDLELVGLWVHSDSKAGRDAGELCGGPPLGVIATQDADALLDLGADVVCYTASSDIRPDGVIDDLCRMLAPGANVVSTSFVPLSTPKAAGPGVLERLEAACQEGGTSFYTSGIDPGFGNAGITIHALALCKEVRTVRMMEIVNYATWDNPFTMFEIMGFGKSDPEPVAAALPRQSTALAWGPVLHLVADALGLTSTSVVERHEVHHRRHRHRDRVGHRGRRHHLGHALRDRRGGRRRGTRSWSSTSPASATRTPPTGRRARATGS
jgi:hypothetical protein